MAGHDADELLERELRAWFETYGPPRHRADERGRFRVDRLLASYGPGTRTSVRPRLRWFAPGALALAVLLAARGLTLQRTSSP